MNCANCKPRRRTINDDDDSGKTYVDVEFCPEHAAKLALVDKPSVLQDWLTVIPIRMQSTLILGLRGPDTHVAPNVKAVGRWLRGLAFKPGNPDNVAEFMKADLPERITEKGPTAKELEFCSQHFYSHLMHALEVVAYRHCQHETRHHAYQLFSDMCNLMHLSPESRSDFEQRLGHREWPGGKQPDTAKEAIELLAEYDQLQVQEKRS